MRIAFFGGTFDPPHLGHTAIAEAALQRCDLDEILMAPVATQPLKQGATSASFADRLAMVRLACEGHPRLRASELDAPRRSNGDSAQKETPGYAPNYTYDTLVHLRAQLAPTDELFCLLGADSFRMLQRWYRGPELLLLCDLIVAGRPGFPVSEIGAYLPASFDCEGPRVIASRIEWRMRDRVSGEMSRLWLLPDLEYDISATAVRAALDCSGSDAAQKVLAPAVAGYACAHHLYREA